MIYDQLSHLSVYRPLHARLASAIDFVLGSDLDALPLGRHAVDGDDVYAMVQEYETKPVDAARWEAHRKYVDLQLMLVGEERIDVADVGSLAPVGSYDEEKDFTFFESNGYALPLIVRPREFAIFLPHDAHRPTIAPAAPTRIRKLVAKIRAW